MWKLTISLVPLHSLLLTPLFSKISLQILLKWTRRFPKLPTGLDQSEARHSGPTLQHGLCLLAMTKECMKSHESEITAGSAAKTDLMTLIWPQILWGEKHIWFNTKKLHHRHVSRTSNGADTPINTMGTGPVLLFDVKLLQLFFDPNVQIRLRSGRGPTKSHLPLPQ